MITIYERVDGVSNEHMIDTKLNNALHATTRDEALEVARTIVSGEFLTFEEKIDDQHFVVTIRVANIVCIESKLEPVE